MPPREWLPGEYCVTPLGRKAVVIGRIGERVHLKYLATALEQDSNMVLLLPSLLRGVDDPAPSRARR